MAKYQSHFKQLGFYVGKELKTFSNGEYVTEDKATIDVLDSMTDCVKVDEPKAAPKAKAKSAEEKPKAKAPSTK